MIVVTDNGILFNNNGNYFVLFDVVIRIIFILIAHHWLTRIVRILLYSIYLTFYIQATPLVTI